MSSEEKKTKETSEERLKAERAKARWEAWLKAAADDEGREKKKPAKDRSRAFIITQEDGSSSVREIDGNQEVVLISGGPDAGAERLNAMRHIIATRGTETMSVIAMEEPAELIQAVSKILRYGLTDESRASLAEEMADVRIVLGELSIMYGIGNDEIGRIMDRKLQREMARIEAERRRSGNEDCN